MSAELDALLDAIRANPEDDLPRLALADWCLEQADPAEQARGEFIHLRCRSALLPPDDPARGQLEQRTNALRTQFEASWLGDLGPLLTGWDFERGCVLIELRPRTRQAASLDRLARTAGWRWVIGVRGVLLERGDVERIARSRLLAQLTSLDLRDSAVGARGARLLAGSSHSSHLAALHLDYCRLGDDGVVALAESPSLARLTTLRLGNNDVGQAGASSLACSKHLRRLVTLDLSRNPIGDAGARALASSGTLTSLRELVLTSCNLTDRGAGALASSRLEGLALLDLTDNRNLGEFSRAELRERFGDRVRLSITAPSS